MNAGSGSVIFVDLGSRDAAVTTKILLSQSADAGVFTVLDKNGTDGEASFSLPAPGSYTIWGTCARYAQAESSEKTTQPRSLRGAVSFSACTASSSVRHDGGARHGEVQRRGAAPGFWAGSTAAWTIRHETIATTAPLRIMMPAS